MFIPPASDTDSDGARTGSQSVIGRPMERTWTLKLPSYIVSTKITTRTSSNLMKINVHYRARWKSAHSAYSVFRTGPELLL